MSRLERIVAACGGLLLDDGQRALIRSPGHGPKDRSASLLEAEDGRIVIHCFSPRDDWRRVRDALAARGLLDEVAEPAAPVSGPTSARTPRRIPIQPAQEERVTRARRLWDEARPLAGSIAERYLKRRAIAAGDDMSAGLRFHPRMTSLEDRRRYPALLAALTEASGEVQGVQATLLSTYGAAKAPLATPRRVIGRLNGGAVRLAPAGDALIIAEGVETAVSASAALGLPAWAALSADNLARFDPPKQISRLIIAFDQDGAGRGAADKLKHRFTDSMQVSMAPPPDAFNDWNDWARARRRD